MFCCCAQMLCYQRLYQHLCTLLRYAVNHRILQLLTALLTSASNKQHCLVVTQLRSARCIRFDAPLWLFSTQITLLYRHCKCYDHTCTYMHLHTLTGTRRRVCSHHSCTSMVCNSGVTTTVHLLRDTAAL
jgi:hypothetical protein